MRACEILIVEVVRSVFVENLYEMNESVFVTDVWLVIASNTQGPRDVMMMRYTCKPLYSGLKYLHRVRLHRWCTHKVNWIKARYRILGFEDSEMIKCQNSASSMNTLLERQFGKPVTKRLIVTLMVNIYESLVKIWARYASKCAKMIQVYEKRTKALRSFFDFTLHEIRKGYRINNVTYSDIKCTIALVRNKRLPLRIQSTLDTFLNMRGRTESISNIKQLAFWRERHDRMLYVLDKKRKHLLLVEEAKRLTRIHTSATNERVS